MSDEPWRQKYDTKKDQARKRTPAPSDYVEVQRQ